MRHTWDPQQPVESLFKHIQDCADYSEAVCVLIGNPHQINVGYAGIKNQTPKNLGTIQGSILRRTLGAQANAG
jgi:hypothetical protein